MDTVEHARTQFQQLSRVDLGDWGARRIVAAAHELGWEPDDTTRPTHLASGSPWGPALVVPAPDDDDPDDDPDDGGHLAAVRVPVAPAADFPATIAAATAVMGFPAPMTGGPGPWVRWRRPPGDGAGPGTSIGLLRADDAVWVELIATGTWESQARRWFATGEGIDELPYRWLALRRHPSLQGLTTGARLVDDERSAERGIELTLEDLLDGLEALAGPADPAPTGRLRFTRPAGDATTFFDVTLGPGRALTFRASATHDLDSHGWHRLEKRTWLCTWPSAGPAECAEAASVAARTLRADGGRPGYARARLAGRTRVELPGLGFARSPSEG